MAESQAGESKGGWVGLSLSGGLARASAQPLGTSGLCVCTGPPQPWVATPQNGQQWVKMGVKAGGLARGKSPPGCQASLQGPSQVATATEICASRYQGQD